MKYLTIVLLALIPAMAWSHGSDTGHERGHHEHDGSPSTVSNQVTVDNQTDIANTARSSSNSSVRSNNISESRGRAESYSGDSSASMGSVTVSGDRNDYPASSPAHIYTQVCQSGMSAQTRSGGFGIVSSDQFCDYWKAATMAMAAYRYELSNPTHCETVKAEITCPVEGFVDCDIKTCKSPKAQIYLDAYHENTQAALALLSNTKHTALADRIAGQLFRPGSLLALLFLL